MQKLFVVAALLGVSQAFLLGGGGGGCGCAWVFFFKDYLYWHSLCIFIILCLAPHPLHVAAAEVDSLFPLSHLVSYFNIPVHCSYLVSSLLPSGGGCGCAPPPPPCVSNSIKTNYNIFYRDVPLPHLPQLPVDLPPVLPLLPPAWVVTRIKSNIAL